MHSEFPVAPAMGNSDLSIDNGPLSDFFDELITSCQIVLRFCLGKGKHNMAFVVDFDHLSLQMGNIEPKQKQKTAVKALLSGKYVMTVLPTGFSKIILYESFVLLRRTCMTQIKRH